MQVSALCGLLGTVVDPLQSEDLHAHYRIQRAMLLPISVLQQNTYDSLRNDDDS